MAIDDDPIEIKARQIAEDSNVDGLTVAQSLCYTVTNVFMPKHIGEAITGILGSVSQQRWNQRVSELLTDFALRVVNLQESIPDGAYYGSEEFQALLIEAIDQERTNRFEQKRKMLAAALAKSGTREHRESPDKELYVRLLRALTPSDLSLLAYLKNETSDFDPAMRQVVPDNYARFFGEPEESAVRRLEGLGLSQSIAQLQSSEHERFEEMAQAVDYVYRIAREDRVITYRISEFGLRFLEFMSETQNPESRGVKVSPWCGLSTLKLGEIRCPYLVNHFVLNAKLVCLQ